MTRSKHDSEMWLLSGVAFGVVALLLVVAVLKREWDIAACLLVLQSIVGVIRDRPAQRTTERMGDQLAGSAPTTDASKTGTLDVDAETVNVTEAKK